MRASEDKSADGKRTPVWSLDAAGSADDPMAPLREICAEFESARALLKEAFHFAPDAVGKLGRLADLATEAASPETIEARAETIQALVVECAGVRVALPARAVIDVVHPLERSAAPEGRAHIRVRGRQVPLATLAELLRLTPSGLEQIAVVIRVGKSALALALDRVRGVADATIEEAPESRLFAGAAILPDGAAIMLIDLDGVVSSAGLGRAKSRAKAKENEQPRVPMLVFRVAGGGVCAAPLSLVARIERLERCVAMDGRWMSARRGVFLPLVDCEGRPTRAEEGAELLVFARDGVEIALVAEEIVETAEAYPDALLREGGGLSLNGRVAALVDVERLWRTPESETAPAPPRILVVGLRRVAMLLTEAGYEATFVVEPEAALDRHARGERVDLVLADAIFGEELMRVLQRAPGWRHAPALALPPGVADEDLLADVEEALAGA